MKRIDYFEAFKNHAWFNRVYKRLSENEREIAHKFIEQNDGLDKGSFELAVNRMFLDKQKPKHYKEILELLTCANSSLPKS